MRFRVVFEGWVVTAEGDLPPRDEIRTYLDAVTAELSRLGFDDASTASDPSKRIQISVGVDAVDWEEAQEFGSSVIRTGFHATGAATPDWSIDWCRVTIEKSQLASA